MSATISPEELEAVRKTDPLAGLVWDHWIETGKARVIEEGLLKIEEGNRNRRESGEG